MMARQHVLYAASCACLWGLTAQAQEAGQQAANTTSTSSSSGVSISWIVQRADQAAGLGIGVFMSGWVLILFLSLVFGNWGLSKAAEGRDDAHAPAAEVHVNVTQKKEKKAKHNQGQFIAN